MPENMQWKRVAEWKQEKVIFGLADYKSDCPRSRNTTSVILLSSSAFVANEEREERT